MKILLKLFSLKLLASILGLIYSVLQVRYFGASRTIEIFFAAQSLVYLVTSLTQSGQLAEIFLPEYHKLNTIQEKLGFSGLNVVLNRMFIFGTILISVVFVFAPFFIEIMVPGFSQEDKEFAVLIFRVLLPILFLQLAISFFTTVLNAEQKFGRAELLGLTNSIVNIVVLVVLFPFIQLWALVVSLLLGKIIEFVFYIWQLVRNGYTYAWILRLTEFNHVSFFKTMQSTFLYVGATQVYSVVLTASISYLPEGTYAIFRYVQNLANKVKGLFIQPFLTIFFTNYSLLINNAKSVSKEFNKNMNGIININTIAIIGTILLGDYIIDFIWGGDKFSSSDVKLAFIFLLFNLLAVLISTVGAVYRKMSVVLGKAKVLYLYWVLAQLITAVLTFLLIKYFSIIGLYFIIPINTFLMSLTSVYVFFTTPKPIKYRILSKNNLIGVLLVMIAALLKNYVIAILNIKDHSIEIITFSLCLIVLSLYPIITTYRLFKSEKKVNTVV